jgi:hypothetical protein
MRHINEPASLPPPEKSDGMSSKLSALIDELRRSSREYGLESDDPFSPVMSALVHVLQWLGALVSELRKITVDYGNQTLQRLQAMRTADEAAAARLQTQMEADRVRIVYDFGASISDVLDRATVGRLRAEVWKIGLGAAFALAVCTAASLALGYRWGRANAEVEIYATASRLEAAFRYGLSGASSWVGLMTWNNIDFALRQCDDRKLSFKATNGRRACNVPLWIEQDLGAPHAVLEDIVSEARRLQDTGRHSSD